MQRATQLMGKAIVTADTGERLGTVSDLLLDEERNQLVGLVVRSGWLGGEQVLPFAAIKTLGRDAVVARSAHELIGRKEWSQQTGHDEPVPPPE